MKLFHNKNENDRRFKIAYLPHHAFLRCIAENTRLPTDIVVRVALDVDEHTEVIERFYDFSRQAEAVILYNMKWDNVPLGEALPELRPQFDYVKMQLSQPSLRLQDNFETYDRYLNEVDSYMRACIIAGIEQKTNRPVKKVQYDQEKQATRFLGENGELLDIIEDTDERLNTFAVVRTRLRFLEWEN